MVDDLKDKDGFYLLYGEALLEKIQELERECITLAEDIGIKTEEVLKLLEIVVGGGGGIRTPGGL